MEAVNFCLIFFWWLIDESTNCSAVCFQYWSAMVESTDVSDLCISFSVKFDELTMRLGEDQLSYSLNLSEVKKKNSCESLNFFCHVPQMSLTWRMAPLHQTTTFLLLLHRSGPQTMVATSWPAASAAGPSRSPTSWHSSSTNRAAAAPETKPPTPTPRPPHLPTAHSSASPTPSRGRASSS